MKLKTMQIGYHGYDQGFSCDAGAGGTNTWTSPTGINNNEIFRCSMLVDDWVAGVLSNNVFGSGAYATTVDGTIVWYAKSDGTDTVILTADGTGDGDLEALSVKRLNGISFANSVYHTTIQNGDVQATRVTFPAPVWVGNNGFILFVTTGGTSSTLDINVFYEIM
jgi:hypothetical protein